MAGTYRVRDQHVSILSVGYWLELQGHAPSRDEDDAIVLRSKLFLTGGIYLTRVDALARARPATSKDVMREALDPGCILLA